MNLKEYPIKRLPTPGKAPRDTTSGDMKRAVNGIFDAPESLPGWYIFEP
jgi:hypothetical protein